MLYQVKEKFARGNETVIAKFTRINDAKLFIENKLAIDTQMRVAVSYALYEGMDKLEEFAAGSGGAGTQSGASGSAGGQQSGFRPSPLQTAPRPTGTWPSSFKDEDQDKGK